MLKLLRNKKLIFFISLLFIISIFLTGCSNDSGSNTESAKNPPSETGNIFLMDTLITMKVYGVNAQEVIDKSFDRLKDIENEMSRTIENSEISKINSSPGKAIQVSTDTFRVIKKSLEYAEYTDGRFDPSIGPLVELWGIGTDHARVPSEQEIKKARDLVNYKWVVINKDEKTVKLLKEGMLLDLGAITKGYAADEVRTIVKNAGFESAYVNLGGNVLVIGSKPDGTPWNIGIQDPRQERGNVIASLEVSDKTVVTSGNYERYFEKDGVIYHHILNPFTGKPTRNNLTSISIITRDSFDADALSTSAYIMGVENGMKMVENLDNIEAIFVTDNQEVILSSGLQDKVELLNSDFHFLEGDSFAGNT